MVKLNNLQYSKIKEETTLNQFSLSALLDNEKFEELYSLYKKLFGFKKLKTFSNSKEGFLGLFLQLKGKIAISLGETQALIEAGKLYESLGFEILWLPLEKDGKVNLSKLQKKDIDFLFLSSYVMDTFVKTDLKKAKELTKATLISNASANFDKNSDIVYFDSYKLTGFNISCVLLFNKEEFELLPVGQLDTLAVKLIFEALEIQKFNYDLKTVFLEELKNRFQENIYFFVEPENTLEYSLHFGLKGIKAREFIRTLALHKIFLTNGEGCSLGLSKPSRVIQVMGYSEDEARNCINLSFVEDLTKEQIKKVADLMFFKYKQLKSFL